MITCFVYIEVMNRYKFQIFPSEPQRHQIDMLLKLSLIQWNYAVLTRERLINYLYDGKFAKLFETVLARSKNDNHPVRKKAIQNLLLENPCIPYHEAGRVYDAYQFSGDLFADSQRSWSNVSAIIEEVGRVHKYDPDRVIEQLSTSINIQAGLLAIDFMKKSFRSQKQRSIAQCRTNLTGFSPNSRWHKAICRGTPRLKKIISSFSFSPYCFPSAIFRERACNCGYFSYLSPLDRKSCMIVTDYDRSLNDNCFVREITLKKCQDDVYFLIILVEDLLPRSQQNLFESLGMKGLIVSGSMTTRSFFPFPSNMVMQFVSKSMSLTRRRRHSMSLSPQP